MAVSKKPGQLKGPQQNLGYWQESDFLISLSKTEYNGNFQGQYSCSCQEIMMFASYAGCTGLMSKIIVLLNLHASWLPKKSNTSLPEGVRQSLRNWKEHCSSEAMDCNLKRTCDACLSRQLGPSRSIPWFPAKAQGRFPMRKLWEILFKGWAIRLLGFEYQLSTDVV